MKVRLDEGMLLCGTESRVATVAVGVSAVRKGEVPHHRGEFPVEFGNSPATAQFVRLKTSEKQRKMRSKIREFQRDNLCSVIGMWMVFFVCGVEWKKGNPLGNPSVPTGIDRWFCSRYLAICLQRIVVSVCRAGFPFDSFHSRYFPRRSFTFSIGNHFQFQFQTPSSFRLFSKSWIKFIFILDKYSNLDDFSVPSEDKRNDIIRRNPTIPVDSRQLVERRAYKEKHEQSSITKTATVFSFHFDKNSKKQKQSSQNVSS